MASPVGDLETPVERPSLVELTHMIYAYTGEPKTEPDCRLRINRVRQILERILKMLPISTDDIVAQAAMHDASETQGPNTTPAENDASSTESEDSVLDNAEEEFVPEVKEPQEKKKSNKKNAAGKRAQRAKAAKEKMEVALRSQEGLVTFGLGPKATSPLAVFRRFESDVIARQIAKAKSAHRPFDLFKSMFTITNMKAIQSALVEIHSTGPVGPVKTDRPSRNGLPLTLRALLRTIDEYHELKTAFLIQDMAMLSSSGLIAEHWNRAVEELNQQDSELRMFIRARYEKKTSNEGTGPSKENYRAVLSQYVLESCYNCKLTDPDYETVKTRFNNEKSLGAAVLGLAQGFGNNSGALVLVPRGSQMRLKMIGGDCLRAMAKQLVKIEPTIRDIVVNLTEYIGNPVVDGHQIPYMRIEEVDLKTGNYLEWFNPAAHFTEDGTIVTQQTVSGNVTELPVQLDAVMTDVEEEPMTDVEEEPMTDVEEEPMMSGAL